MSTYLEMQKLAANPDAVRTLARTLLATGQADWNEWETDFLRNMSTYDRPDPISTRQREVLVELRDTATRHSTVGGMSVRNLIAECWLGREDLGEDDEDNVEFIVRLYDERASSLSRRQLSRLLACCRRLGLLDRSQYLAI